MWKLLVITLLVGCTQYKAGDCFKETGKNSGAGKVLSTSKDTAVVLIKIDGLFGSQYIKVEIPSSQFGAASKIDCPVGLKDTKEIEARLSEVE